MRITNFFINGPTPVTHEVLKAWIVLHARTLHTRKGLAKLGNIVAETLFPVMFPRWLN